MLSRVHKLMLLAVLKTGGGGVSKVCRVCLSLAEEYGVRDLDPRRFKDILLDLELMGFVKVIKRRKSLWSVKPLEWIAKEDVKPRVVESLARDLQQ